MWRSLAHMAQLRAFPPSLSAFGTRVVSGPLCIARVRPRSATFTHALSLEPNRSFSVGLRGKDCNDKRYTNGLKTSKADLEFFTKPGVLWEALEADALKANTDVKAHLDDVVKSAQTFMKADGLYDRQELLDVFDPFVRNEGRFGLFLGGKNVGKSRVVRCLIELYAQPLLTQRLAQVASGPVVPWLIPINARLYGADLTKGLVEALHRVVVATALYKAMTAAAKAVAFFPAIVNMLATNSPLADTVNSMPEDVRDVGLKAMHIVGERPQTFEQAIGKVLGVAALTRTFPTLIVDEANLAFNAEGDAVRAEQTKGALELLVMNTKELNKMNVLFVSSEHAYPFHLSKGLQFNLANFTKIFVAGELPPANMLELLQKKWNMGPRLAELFVASYGGHILRAILALENLAIAQKKMAAVDGPATQDANGIVRCLKQEESHPGIRETLTLLAVKGFAPVSEPLDPIAEIISRNNVGGVVQNHSYVSGFDPTDFSGADVGIVPTCQMTRLVIAKKLMEAKK